MLSDDISFVMIGSYLKNGLRSLHLELDYKNDTNLVIINYFPL